MIIFLENVYSTKVSRYLVFDTIRLMAIVAQVNEVAPGPHVNLYIIFKKKNIIFLPTDQDLKTNWVWEDKQLFRGGLIKFVISINYTFKAKWSKISQKIYLKILDDFLSYKLYFNHIILALKFEYFLTVYILIQNSSSSGDRYILKMATTVQPS